MRGAVGASAPIHACKDAVLSKSPDQIDAAPNGPPEKSGGRLSLLFRLAPFVKLLGGWAGGRKSRRLLVAVAILALIAATVVVWSLLARIALRSGRVPLQVALDALDAGNTEQARTLVTRMLTDGLTPRTEYGGPLFVLGAIKAYDAEHDATPEKRRIDYLVASRYLKESQSYGFPPGREKAGSYLLAKSLLASHQFEEGIDILDELLAAEGDEDGPMTWAIHRLLASTCLWMAEPKLEKALAHSAKSLENKSPTPDEQADALLTRAFCLARSGRFGEAAGALDAVPADSSRRADALLAGAQITFEEMETALATTAAQDHAGVLAKAMPHLEAAMRSIQQAAELSKNNDARTRRADFLRGWGFKLKGDIPAAMREFMLIRQLYGDTPEAQAAALNEADVLRQKGDYDGALVGYRRVLESIDNVTAYYGVVLPLAKVRERMLAAFGDFVERNKFDSALELLSHFTPLFPRTEELTFRGEMLERWGRSLLSEAPTDARELDKSRHEGLRRLREAGIAYEELAELRYATEAYTNDLWAGAENYYLGHSYTRAILLLNRFLANEPEMRNAQALLRLGQSYLALGKIPPSIAAFEECIEFHPLDSATYQARIDCAKAYWYHGDVDKAETLLRENIDGSALKPTSREWTDSLFELGMLLYDKAQFSQAIGTLEEAIDRYPKDSRVLLAKYVLGESYRGWAEEAQQRARESRTTTEREKHQEQASQHLEIALKLFVDVQKSITRMAQDVHQDPMMAAMLRNCDMLAGTVLFDLGRYKEAISAFSNVSSRHPNDPFVLETFVQISNCWRRLDEEEKARGAIQQAQLAFNRLPADADFTAATALSRDEWGRLLRDMVRW
jgi:tetratricopeptide (TPR) repeat protein